MIFQHTKFFVHLVQNQYNMSKYQYHEAKIFLAKNVPAPKYFYSFGIIRSPQGTDVLPLPPNNSCKFTKRKKNQVPGVSTGGYLLTDGTALQYSRCQQKLAAERRKCDAKLYIECNLQCNEGAQSAYWWSLVVSYLQSIEGEPRGKTENVCPLWEARNDIIVVHFLIRCWSGKYSHITA